MNRIFCSSIPVLVFGLSLLSVFYEPGAAELKPSEFSSVTHLVREKQLTELRQVHVPSNSVAFHFSTLLFPSAKWLTLHTPYGELQGYPHHNSFGVLMMNPLQNSSHKVGFVWFLDYAGWDSEDFVFWAPRHPAGSMQLTQTLGYAGSDTSLHLAYGAGILRQSYTHSSEYAPPEKDLTWYWAHAAWTHLGVHYLGDPAPRRLELTLAAASREVWGGSDKGWKTWLPVVQMIRRWPDEESGSAQAPSKYEIGIEQNIFKQHIFALGQIDPENPGRSWAMMRFRPDPGGLVSLDLGGFRTKDGHWRPAGGVEFPFFRLSYSHPNHSTQLLGQTGLWVAELQISVQTLTGERFLRPGSPRSASMVSEVIRTTPMVPSATESGENRGRSNSNLPGSSAPASGGSPVRGGSQ